MDAAKESFDEKAEMDEKEHADICEIFDGDAYDRMVASKNRGSDQIVAKFLNVMLKQELMKSSSKKNSQNP